MIALTSNSWAPVMAVNQLKTTTWRASRPKAKCSDTQGRDYAQNRPKQRTKYACLYRGVQLLYSVTIVTNAPKPSNTGASTTITRRLSRLSDYVTPPAPELPLGGACLLGAGAGVLAAEVAEAARGGAAVGRCGRRGRPTGARAAGRCRLVAVPVPGVPPVVGVVLVGVVVVGVVLVAVVVVGRPAGSCRRAPSMLSCFRNHVQRRRIIAAAGRYPNRQCGAEKESVGRRKARMVQPMVPSGGRSWGSR